MLRNRAKLRLSSRDIGGLPAFQLPPSMLGLASARPQSPTVTWSIAPRGRKRLAKRRVEPQRFTRKADEHDRDLGFEERRVIPPDRLQ